MIVIFPLLMDNTISSNIIPGICATLERFLIVYKSDEIMKIGGLSPVATAAGVARGTAEILVTASMAALGQIIVKKYLPKTFGENKETLPHQDLFISNMLVEIQEDKKNFVNTYNILEDFYDMYPETSKTKPTPEKEKTAMKSDISFSDVLKTKTNLEVKTGKLDLNTTLSLEPTYITISGKWGTEVIGVKVIPVPVDPKPFVKQLMIDRSGDHTETFLGPIQRKMTRIFRGFMGRFKSNKNLKADPFEDIIYATSKYGSNVFCLLNLASLSSDKMLKDMDSMDNIFKMGWNSVIVADDISKRAYFCMKEFGGICSSINYSYMMTSLNDKFEKSFEKLEDLKKSSSIYFRANSKRPSQILGESVVKSYLDKFKNIGIPCLTGECDDED